MFVTYLSVAVLLAAAVAAGRLAFHLCGRREPSALDPAIGLALLCALGWGAANLIGPAAAAVLLAGLALAGAVSAAGTLRRLPREELRLGLAVAVGALVLASLPFLAEGRFGILGTSLNPDMSQHLFAADRLAGGGEERLIAEGYPLGPHALVVGLGELGIGLVQGFGGLTVAIALASAIAPLGLLRELGPARRGLAALLVAFAYMSASYLIQGAFKETLQALFVLAFALALHELARGALGGRAPAARWRLACGVPLALLAAGAVYAYSFPGLAWLVGALAALVASQALRARRSRTSRLAGAQRLLGPAAVRRRAARTLLAPLALALAVAALAIAPELGRVVRFASFETFAPDGPGLGNLFNRVSPLEALGIWPSGDFRLDPGAGFAPAFAFWLGGAVALSALAFGLLWWLRRGELAVPAALAAAFALYLYPLVAGTPYQEAKALAIAAPLAMLVSARALLAATPPVRRWTTRRPLVPALAAAFLAAAGGCSVLALVNGPVGPERWSPDLIELREEGELEGSTLALLPDELLAAHGFDLVAWELRGGRACVAPEGAPLEPGVRQVLTAAGDAERPPFAGLSRRRAAGPYTVWDVPGAKPAGSGPCPFIPDGARADPDAAG